MAYSTWLSFLLAIMGVMYRGSIRSLEAQKKVQLQIDYETRKQAFLRSVVTIAPVTVANTMINGINADFDGRRALFHNASTVSRMKGSRAKNDTIRMGFDTHKNGNTGDVTVNSFRLWDYATMVTVAPTPTLLGNTTAFSQLRYPDIHFGYYSLDANGNKTFIARRNSWVIKVAERAADLAAAGLVPGLLNDNYTLDVYEIPAQLAISSSAFTNIGEIGGVNYDPNNVTIAGNVYAKKADLTFGNVAGLSTTQGAAVQGGATVGETDTFDGVTNTNAGARTTHENTTGAFYPISKASDYSRTLFLPINPGFNFFDRFATSVLDSGTGRYVPSQPWYEYSCGSHQCEMKLDVIEVVSDVDTTPLALEFSHGNFSTIIMKSSSGYDPGGTPVVHWPNNDDGVFPFLSELADDNTAGIAIHLGRLAAWVMTASGGGGGNIQDYNSLVINSNYNRIDVPIPTAISSPITVILRNCDNLTMFTGDNSSGGVSNGFSLVTNFRLHILENLNQVERSGVGGTHPALSVFAPTISYGLANQARSLTGTLGSLSQDSAAINILELADTSGGANAANVRADLRPITAITDLPPINLMNWLVMIKQ